MLKRFFTIILCTISISACTSEPEDTHPGQPVTHRQHAFKELLRTFEPMGVMLRTREYKLEYDPEKFKNMLTKFMAQRDEPWKYFLSGTNYPPSRALSEVWSETERFTHKKQSFIKATNELKAVSGDKDRNVVFTAYKRVERTCSNCHNLFRKSRH